MREQAWGVLMIKASLSCIVLLGSIGLSAYRADADYIFSAISYPGATITIPYGINDSGVVVGGWVDVNSTVSGFSLSGTTYSPVGYANARYSMANGVNGAGVIAGQYGDTSGVDHGYTLNGTTYTTAHHEGATTTILTGIAGSGNVVGYYTDATYGSHGFVRSGTTDTLLSIYPGSAQNSYYGINSAGSVVGSYRDNAYGLHGFVLTSGTYTAVDYPGATATVARGVNDAGVVVGYYTDVYGADHGFVLNGATYTTVDYPGAAATVIFGVNGAGALVGNYVKTDGGTSGFLATPDANVGNGQCGGAHNSVLAAAPVTNLCSSGNATPVAGSGPWTWSCQGTNSGVTVSCQAQLAAGRLTVVKNGSGSGAVTSSLAGVSCGSSCSALFPATTLILTGTPSGSSHDPAWQGCTWLEDALCILTLSGDTTVTATFAGTGARVLYNDNGGTGGTPPVDTISYAAGGAATVLGNNGGLTLTNASFAGWNTATDGSGATYAPGAALTMGGADVMLYALWAAPVELDNERLYFQTLAAACAVAQEGETIKATAAASLSGFILNSAITVTLAGGYDASFLAEAGYSVINGAVTVVRGTLVANRVIIN